MNRGEWAHKRWNTACRRFGQLRGVFVPFKIPDVAARRFWHRLMLKATEADGSEHGARGEVREAREGMAGRRPEEWKRATCLPACLLAFQILSNGWFTQPQVSTCSCCFPFIYIRSWKIRIGNEGRVVVEAPGAIGSEPQVVEDGTVG